MSSDKFNKKEIIDKKTLQEIRNKFSLSSRWESLLISKPKKSDDNRKEIIVFNTLCACVSEKK